MKATILLIICLLMGGAIILAELFTSWPIYLKLAPAAGILLIGLISLAGGGSKTGSATTPVPPKSTTKPTTSNSDSSWAEKLVLFALSLAMVGGVLWLLWFKVIIPIHDSPHGETVQNLPTVRIVNNGFHRHDAKYPPLIQPRAFNQKVQAGRIYETIPVQPGDRFMLHFDRPVEMRTLGARQDPFVRRTDPGRYRATQAGVIQIRSETGQNQVRVSPTN